ncbi:MAG: acyltransferase [Anaerolineales bacterium]|nr:acyltransferase [Anaerolineales bacterium]
MEIRKLNALRGIAALIVVISHYSNETDLLRGLLGNGAGQFGVMLFFILSGFLMSYLYLNKKFDKENVQYYTVARIARVIPLFVLVVLISFLFQISGVTGIFFAINNVNSLLSHLMLFSGMSVLWTIPPEIQFYVLFLFLWGLYFQKKGYMFSLIIILYICLIFLNFPSPRWNVLGLDFHTYLIPSLPYFFVGIVFGRIYCTWEAPDFLRKNIFVLTLLILPLMYPNIFSFITGRTHKMWTDIGIFFVVSAVFFVLIFLVPEDNPLLSNPFGDFLGKISYSLYLLHIPILNLIVVPSKKFPGVFLLLFIALSLIVAYTTYLVIEAPARRGIRLIVLNRRMLT